MILTVHLFGRVRELAGTHRLEVQCEPGTTVGQLRALLTRQVPGVGPLLERCAIAIEQEFAGDDIAITAGAEVAVIPPVSGG